MRHLSLAFAAAVLVAVASHPAKADLIQDCYAVNVDDLDKKIEVCTRAINNGPQNSRLASAYNNRGKAYIRKGDYDRALSDLDSALRLDPKDAYAWDNRGDLWREQGEFDKAIADYSKAIQVDGAFLAAYLDRGMAYEKAGKLAQARRDYEIVLDSTGHTEARYKEIDDWARDMARRRLDELDNK